MRLPQVRRGTHPDKAERKEQELCSAANGGTLRPYAFVDAERRGGEFESFARPQFRQERRFERGLQARGIEGIVYGNDGARHSARRLGLNGGTRGQTDGRGWRDLRRLRFERLNGKGP
jgi:hypothetical protein